MKSWKLWVAIVVWIGLGLAGNFINEYKIDGGYGEEAGGYENAAVEEQQ